MEQAGQLRARKDRDAEKRQAAEWISRHATNII
jgi:hypothetical protein